MDATTWTKVKSILHEILDVPVNERTAYIERLGLSAEMRSEIDSLMAFEDAAEDMMQLSAVEFSKDFIEEEAPEMGQVIGAYRIIGELGHGGMGAVFLAERADGKFEQRVALKLLKREMNTASLRHRFEIEREILSRLEHPNIARLLDAGTAKDKTPFLAMEYVDGLPIDLYCVKNQLDLNARIELFRKVCLAVDFAHRNLVVHRDLKPGNILVNDQGIPKLLDFGISKLLSDDLAPTSTVTRLGVMTPSYASPEQLQNESVTTATDIYSLGVILYELLSGHRPFEAKEKDIKEMYRAVIEADPILPSAMADTVPRAIPEIDEPKIPGNTAQDATRITLPQTRSIKSHYLRGDLDNIVLKAIKKEPSRRYSSAENLADDLRRHIEGLPVRARPDTFTYRASKFVRRNGISVVAGTLVLFAVSAGVVATLWQARNAQVERAKAERRFSEVRLLANSFITEFSPMIENLPGSTPARKLLVTRALTYLGQLSQEASDDLELQYELAIAYEKVGDIQGNPYNPNIGDVKGALKSYETSVAIRENLRSLDNTRSLDASDASLFEKIGGLQSSGGDYDKGVIFYEKALVLREEDVKADPSSFSSRASLAKALRSRGLIPFFEGDNKKALEYFTRARDIYAKLNKEEPGNDKIAHEYAYIFVNIGEAQGWNDDPISAAENTEKGLAMLIPLAEKHPGDYSFQRSLNLAYNKRAENYEDTKMPEKAVDHYSKGLEIAQRSFRSDPQNFQVKRDVAMGYKKLAQALDSAGRSDESVEKLKLALQTFNELSTDDESNTEALYDVANTRFSLGETYQTMKKHELALETFQRAKDEFDRVLSINPENIYAVRMSTYNIDRIGKCFAALAEKGDKLRNIDLALQNFRTALTSFNNMKDAGKLGDFDIKALPAMEENIRQLESQMK